jgi:hypothetical protein
VSRSLTESEQRFVDYLESHAYYWRHEPDYQQELGMALPPETRPDFLVSKDDGPLVCELRQFDLGSVDEKIASMKTGVLSDKDIYGRERSALVEKARQLEPFAGSGVPLVIVLSNPTARFVPLDDEHMISVIFGNPKWSIPIDTRSGGPAGTGRFLLEDYGAFVSLVRDERGERFVWRHPHVSAVATLHQRTNEQDFIDEVMARHRAEDNSFDAAARAAIAALQEVDEARQVGDIPPGEYQWLEVYELAGEDAVPLPAGDLAGPRDRRYGFLTDGTYGALE